MAATIGRLLRTSVSETSSNTASHLLSTRFCLSLVFISQCLTSVDSRHWWIAHLCTAPLSYRVCRTFEPYGDQPLARGRCVRPIWFTIKKKRRSKFSDSSSLNVGSSVFHEIKMNIFGWWTNRTFEDVLMVFGKHWWTFFTTLIRFNDQKSNQTIEKILTRLINNENN